MQYKFITWARTLLSYYVLRSKLNNKRNIFYERSILIKQLWLEMIKKNGAQSQSIYRGGSFMKNVSFVETQTKCHIFKIWWTIPLKLLTHFQRTTWSYFEQHFSLLFLVRVIYRDGPFIRNVSFVETRKKCFIFKIGEQSL